MTNFVNNLCDSILLVKAFNFKHKRRFDVFNFFSKHLRQQADMVLFYVQPVPSTLEFIFNALIAHEGRSTGTGSIACPFDGGACEMSLIHATLRTI